jgi:hypothetical protein
MKPIMMKPVYGDSMFDGKLSGGARETASHRLYPTQDPQALGRYYLDHVAGLTEAGLDGKAEICEQLAWRDKVIGELRDEVSELLFQLEGLPAKPITIRDHRQCALFEQSIERLKLLTPEWDKHPARES